MSGCGGQGLCSSSSSGIGGGCQQHQHSSAAAAPEQAGSFGSWVRRKAANGTDSHAAADAHADAPEQQPLCMKCKAEPAATHIRQQEPYCHACLEAGVCQKARAATRSLRLISTGNRALLALSGGAASAALLYCIAGLQAPPGTADRPVKGKVAFDLAVLHIDCSMQQAAAAAAASAAAAGGPADATGSPAAAAEVPDANKGLQQQEASQQLHTRLAALTAAAGYQQQPLLLHLCDVFCSTEELQQLLVSQQQQQQSTPPEQHQQEQQQQEGQLPQQQQQREERQQRLHALMSAVSDTTGREDLLTHVRDLLLRRAAAALSCNRLLLGDSGSKLAVRVIAAAAKGRGYSLPADLQVLDGRLLASGGPCVLLPFREVTYKELQELCSYKALPLLPLQPPGGSNGSNGRAVGGGGGGADSSNINVLSERFVGEMERSLPASVYTIIRTASHLQPFGFNDPAAMLPEAAAEVLKRRRPQAPSNRQQQQQGTNQAAGAAVHPHCWQLCAICSAPLPQQQQQQKKPHQSSAAAAAAASTQPDSSSGTGSNGGASVAATAASSRLCYSCNKQILQQVKPSPGPEGLGAPAAAAAAGLEAKLQRLKQLLPPGMLLESDDSDEGKS